MQRNVREGESFVSTKDTRAARLEALKEAGRRQSAATVMFHATVAELAGVGLTEEKALDILQRRGPITAGELAKESGLAPASVTGLVDRLERKGLVHRSPDPADRRRVLISTDDERLRALMTPLFAAWTADLDDLFASYGPDEQAVVLDFLERVAEAQRRATDRLRATRRREAPDRA